MKTEQQKFDEYQAAAFRAHQNTKQVEYKTDSWSTRRLNTILRDKTQELLQSKNSNYLNR